MMRSLCTKRAGILALFGLLAAACGHDATAPATIHDGLKYTIVSGDTQTVQVGHTAPASLAISVKDASGKPVAGQHVNFVVTAGGGTVSPPSVVSDSLGIAATTWVLGHLASDSQRVAAQISDPSTGIATTVGVFVANPTADTLKQVIAISGSGQTAAPDSTLHDSLVVRVIDQYGNGVPQRTIHWHSNQAGDVFSAATTITDSSGYTSARLTLGPATSNPYHVVSTVTASEAAIPTPATFSATADAAGSSDVAVTVSLPAPNTPVGDTIHPIVVVKSTYEIASVVAVVGTQHVSLHYSATAQVGTGPGATMGAWIGAIPVADLPQGTFQFSVVATDVHANSSTATFPLLHDQPPSLVITAPLPRSLNTASVHVAATCTDDTPSGCTHLTVTDKATGATVASGTGSVNTTVSLSVEGRADTLIFVAVDAAGQQVRAEREVYINSDSHLSARRTFSGTVVDADATRALIVIPADTPNVVMKLVSGADTTTLGTQQQVQSYGLIGSLTPHGAIAVSGTTVADTRVLNYSNGNRTDLGSIKYLDSFKVSGDFAIWNAVNVLYRRDLQIEVTTQVASNAGLNSNSVAENGDVAYWSTNYQVSWLHNGATTQITHDTVRSWLPVTDGINVVYLKSSDRPWSLIAMYDGVQEIVLSDTARQLGQLSYGSYAANNGWVAYSDLGTQSELQIFTRNPSGQITQVSQFSSTSQLEALGPGGEVVFWNYGDHNRYVSRFPYTTVTSVGPLMGRVVVRGSHFFVIVGSSVAEISF